MKKIVFSIICMIIYSCHDTIDAPLAERESINYTAQTHNVIDANRLCLAELIALTLKDLDFRVFIKNYSFNVESSLNNEIVLIDIWDKNISVEVIFKDLLKSTLDSYGNSCYTDIEQVKESLFNDPLLAIKFPDLIDLKSWDEREIIPLLYVNTIQSVSDSLGSSSGSYVGFHFSGFIDRYEFGLPKFFPLILKWSDDYVLFDGNLTLFTGTPFNEYHDYNVLQNIPEILFSNKKTIIGEEYYLYKLNDLLKELNLSGNNIKPPFQLINCLEQCPYDCIPENERKLTNSQIIIHSQNAEAKEYEFTEWYRWNSHLILEDNVTVLVQTRHDDKNGIGMWRKMLLGTFRLSSLFQVESFANGLNRKYYLDGSLVELPELTLSFNVFGKLGYDTESFVIADNIGNVDLLRFSSSRIKLDRLGHEIELISGEFIWASNLLQDVVKNYDLHCIEKNDTLGFNSVGIICDY